MYFTTETNNLKCVLMEPSFAICSTQDPNGNVFQMSSDNLSTLFDGKMKCMEKTIKEDDGTIVDAVICAKNHFGLRNGISFVNKLVTSMPPSDRNQNEKSNSTWYWSIQITLTTQKTKHSRGNFAFIIHDVVSNTLILSSKLSTVAQHLNNKYARNTFERVSTRGLYEAANKHTGYTGGHHKMRYLVSRCNLNDSHIAFKHAHGIGVIQKCERFAYELRC